MNDKPATAVDADPHRPLKNALGRFATGVAVVAARDPATGALAAITVNSFNSVSLDPPLVLWSIESKASTFDAFMAAAHYGVSVLRADQEAASNLFTRAAAGPENADAFDALAPGGAPVLKTRLAGFDCEVVDRRAAGDHVILLGRVRAFDARAGAPLLYFASGYAVGPHVD
ncbi:MAG: flavin reductase family protein [Parvularculaceae bacterium]